jgi:hypothetical protein
MNCAQLIDMVNHLIKPCRGWGLPERGSAFKYHGIHDF